MQLKLDKPLVVTPEYRERFSRMPEVLVTKESQLSFLSSKVLITVGDAVTATALKYEIIPKLSIIDLKTKRDDKMPLPPDKWDRTLRVTNPAGSITPELWGSVEDSIKFKGKTLIIVQGEEDLASIPCIVYAPEGAIVIYGVPDKGIAVYEVGECLRKVVLGEIEKLIGD
jgi:uncharacterized protein (UPF0218 family)